MFSFNRLLIISQIILVFMRYYELSMALVELDGKRIEIFKTNTDVKQGGPSSPALLNFIAHFMIICNESINIGVFIDKELIDIIVYADYTLLIAQSVADLKLMVSALEKFTKENELEINTGKKFFITTDKKLTEQLTIHNKPIERAEQIKYLGVIINENGNCSAHITKRKSLAYAAVARLTTLGLTNEIIEPSLKARLYTTFIRSILTYGIENCDLNLGQLDEI